MPTKRLPARPSLEHLKHQAKDLAKERAAGRAAACQRIREFHPRFGDATDLEISSGPFILADAYLTIAREHGFPSWARIRAHVATSDGSVLERPHHERIEDPAFRRAVDLVDDGDVPGLRAHLEAHPDVVTQSVTFEGGNYFREPKLLEFIAENPIRHGVLPPTITDVASVILEAGARSDRSAVDSTLALVASGRVARECGVQVALIDLLCDYAADPSAATAPALAHGEFEAVDALLRRGATTDLLVAAATGRLDAARVTLPHADARHRHRALALAAQHGHDAIVALLLDSGEDPNRYNPRGFHSHSTPLHQAALAGHLAVVRVLAEGGARLDMRDIHFDGTPLDWAEHEGRQEVAAYLREVDRQGASPS